MSEPEDDLVERLRTRVTVGTGIVTLIRLEAADRIEAQAKLIDGLREGVMSIWLKHDEPTTVEFLACTLLASIKEQ